MPAAAVIMTGTAAMMYVILEVHAAAVLTELPAERSTLKAQPASARTLMETVSMSYVLFHRYRIFHIPTTAIPAKTVHPAAGPIPRAALADVPVS
jgi:hypothetical protein